MVAFIHKRPSKGIVQVVNPVGTRLPAHATGSGKVMLAHLSEWEIDQLYPTEKLPGRTATTITSKHVLKEALAVIRQQSYAYDDGESEEGVWAVAACIRGEDGRPLAALSVVGPFFRVIGKPYNEWNRIVVEGAREISGVLCFRAKAYRTEQSGEA
jgi:DNA-binding IclR family transcriptional regulator